MYHSPAQSNPTLFYLRAVILFRAVVARSKRNNTKRDIFFSASSQRIRAPDQPIPTQLAFSGSQSPASSPRGALGSLGTGIHAHPAPVPSPRPMASVLVPSPIRNPTRSRSLAMSYSQADPVLNVVHMSAPLSANLVSSHFQCLAATQYEREFLGQYSRCSPRYLRLNLPQRAAFLLTSHTQEVISAAQAVVRSHTLSARP